MTVVEVNFDGLVGPTHHYGGLSPGNLASQQYCGQISHPRQAALEGLQKMKLLADRGIAQAVLPPHERPDIGFLRRHGLAGSEAQVLQQALTCRPDLLSVAASASAMWSANAATVSPAADTFDGRVHLTPANLISTQHRQQESAFTTRILRRIFRDSVHFHVHDPLPDDPAFADEGAANHLRLCPDHASPGVELFVFGRGPSGQEPERFPPRQTHAAGQQVAHQHGLAADRVLLIQQHPAAIDAGVFHNDVIAVANENVLLCHQQAWLDQAQILQQLMEKLPELHLIEVTEQTLSVDEALQTYLFNSQLISLPGGGMLLLCPMECRENDRVRSLLDRIVNTAGPVTEVEFVDVRQSMQNGGGPACLRLRVVLTEVQLAALHQPILLTAELFERLSDWISRNYRDELTIASLADPVLLIEVRTALDELSQLLELGSIYPFQQ